MVADGAGVKGYDHISQLTRSGETVEAVDRAIQAFDADETQIVKMITRAAAKNNDIAQWSSLTWSRCMCLAGQKLPPETPLNDVIAQAVTYYAQASDYLREEIGYEHKPPSARYEDVNPKLVGPQSAFAAVLIRDEETPRPWAEYAGVRDVALFAKVEDEFVQLSFNQSLNHVDVHANAQQPAGHQGITTWQSGFMAQHTESGQLLENLRALAEHGILPTADGPVWADHLNVPSIVEDLRTKAEELYNKVSSGSMTPEDAAEELRRTGDWLKLYYNTEFLHNGDPSTGRWDMVTGLPDMLNGMHSGVLNTEDLKEITEVYTASDGLVRMAGAQDDIAMIDSMGPQTYYEKYLKHLPEHATKHDGACIRAAMDGSLVRISFDRSLDRKQLVRLGYDLPVLE